MKMDGQEALGACKIHCDAIRDHEWEYLHPLHEESSILRSGQNEERDCSCNSCLRCSIQGSCVPDEGRIIIIITGLGSAVCLFIYECGDGGGESDSREIGRKANTFKKPIYSSSARLLYPVSRSSRFEKTRAIQGTY